MAAPSCCTYGLCTKKARPGRTRCADHLGVCHCGRRSPSDNRGAWTTDQESHSVLGPCFKTERVTTILYPR